MEVKTRSTSRWHKFCIKTLNEVITPLERYLALAVQNFKKQIFTPQKKPFNASNFFQKDLDLNFSKWDPTMKMFL